MASTHQPPEYVLRGMRMGLGVFITMGIAFCIINANLKGANSRLGRHSPSCAASPGDTHSLAALPRSLCREGSPGGALHGAGGQRRTCSRRHLRGEFILLCLPSACMRLAPKSERAA
jgi:hypothetical protein